MASFSFFRRSLGQDDVDRYTNTWAVFLFLALSLLSLLMPLSPTLSDSVKAGGHSGGGVSNPAGGQKPEMVPRVKAKCWAPTEFTPASVEYTNAYCSDVANGMLNGVKSSRTLYELTDTAEALDELNLTSIAKSRKGYFENFEIQRAQEKKNEEVRKNTRELVDFRTPVILFLMALCLKLPYILWSLISNTMTASINVGKTLEACVDCRSLDMASQKQVYEETAEAVSDSVRQSRNTASFLYLFLKILTVVVVVGETYFVSKHIVPDIRAMEGDFVEDLFTSLASAPNSEQQQQQQQQQQQELNVTDIMEDPSVGLFDYPNNILRCGLKIRQFKNTQKFIVQCMFTRVDEPMASANEGTSANAAKSTGSSRTSSSSIGGSPTNIHSTLLLYEALFTVVLAFLAVLVIANVLNTVSWILRLLIGSYGKALGLPDGAARDVVLLVHMAHLNAGPRVARGLAKSPAFSTDSQEADGQPMLESKA